MIGVGSEVLGYRIAAPASPPEPGRWWLAEGTEGGDPVWIRTPDPDRHEDTKAIELAWERLRHLEHPVIPAALAIDREIPALAVAAPRGVSLASLIALRHEAELTMTPGTVLDVARNLSDMLVHAHERGRPHGHLSPEVIEVAPDGRLIVWGFGIGPEAPCPSGWWSPERARGRRASGDADQWALGAIIATLVTGRGPWRGDDPEAAARDGDASGAAAQVMEQWAPLGRLVARALAGEPRDRFPSVHPLRQAFFALAQRVRQSSDLARMGTLLAQRNRALAPGVSPPGPVGPALAAPVEAKAVVPAESEPVPMVVVSVDDPDVPTVVGEQEASADPQDPELALPPPAAGSGITLDSPQRPTGWSLHGPNPIPAVAHDPEPTGPAPIYVGADLDDGDPVGRSFEVMPDPSRYLEMDGGTTPTAVPETSADGTVWADAALPSRREDKPADREKPPRVPLHSEFIDVGPAPAREELLDIRRVAPFFVGTLLVLLVAYVWWVV